MRTWEQKGLAKDWKEANSAGLKRYRFKSRAVRSNDGLVSTALTREQNLASIKAIFESERPK